MASTKKNWDSITITDDLMFTTVFGTDTELCRELVERILGIPIDHVEYVNRERRLLPELGAKQIAMDVFVADGEGTVIDVEMQNWDEDDIERRSRYYMSANGMKCIGLGGAYVGMRDNASATGPRHLRLRSPPCCQNAHILLTCWYG